MIKTHRLLFRDGAIAKNGMPYIWHNDRQPGGFVVATEPLATRRIEWT